MFRIYLCTLSKETVLKKLTSKQMAEKYTLCRICFSHFKGLLIYVIPVLRLRRYSDFLAQFFGLKKFVKKFM